MGVYEKGGVRTQELNIKAVVAVLAVLLSGAVSCLALIPCDSSDATISPVSMIYFTSASFDDDDTASDSATVTIDESETTSNTITVYLHFRDSAYTYDTSDITVTYTSKLLDSDGNTVSSGISSGSSGTLTDYYGVAGVNGTKIIVAKQSAGDYTLVVTVTEKGQLQEQTISTTTVSNSIGIHFVEPVTLTATLTNVGQTSISDLTYYFYLDGVKLEDSSDTVSIDKDGSEDVTYTLSYDEYKVLGSGTHTFYVSADGDYPVTGLGESSAHTFYIGETSYHYLDYVVAAVLIILLIVLASILRRPVKNYGKPKSRR